MPFQVSWDIVHHCNLRCKHCYFTSKQLSDSRHVSRDQAVAFVRYLGERKVFHLALAGGEPLLVPWLEDVIAEASRHGVVTALSTNAMLLTGPRAASLWNAGLRSLQVSVDGATAAVHDEIRGLGSYEATIRGIEVAVAQGFAVLIACVILRTNANQIGRIFELAKVLGATGVKVQTLIESGRGAANYEHLSVPPKDLISVLRQLWADKKAFSPDLKIMLPLIPEVLADAREAPEHYYRDTSCLGCQPGLSTVRINNQGDVRACGAQVDGSGTVGNVFTEDFQAIWHQSADLARWRNQTSLEQGLTATSCGSTCGKGCRASSAPAFARS